MGSRGRDRLRMGRETRFAARASEEVSGESKASQSKLRGKAWMWVCA
jgi:hypothetical protein